MVPQVFLELEDKLEYLAILVFQEQKACLDFLVKEDLKVTMELRVMQEFQVRVDYLDLLEMKENEEKEECADLSVHPVQLENVAHQEHQVFQVPMDQWDQKVNLEIVDPLVQ